MEKNLLLPMTLIGAGTALPNKQFAMDIRSLDKNFEYYFTGNDIYGQLFNYQNLNDGSYRMFVNKTNFTYDSEIFNNILSCFLREYDRDGNFCIASVEPKHNLLINNSFQPELLNVSVEQSNDALKFVPTYIYDCNFKWTIYMDNDLDIFITWCDGQIVTIFDNSFLKENADFYVEWQAEVFLETIINRNSFREDFDFQKYKDRICLKNRYLFEC